MRRAVVVFSAQDWWVHSHAHADFQLSIHLQHRVPVLLVNSMGLRRPSFTKAAGRARIFRKLRSTLKRPQRVDDHLWVLSPLFLPVYKGRVAMAANAALVSVQVRAALALLLRARMLGVIFANPVAAPTVRVLRPPRKLFYRVDWNSRLRDGDQASVEAFEQIAFDVADEVVYSSNTLAAIEHPLTGSKSSILRHGYNEAMFARLHSDERRTNVVGFVGSLEEPERLRQLVTLARAVPEATFVAIGAQAGIDDRSEVPIPPNLHLRPAVPHEDIPSNLESFGIALLLVPTDEWGQVASPIKLVEYLAAGLTVVANRTDELEFYTDACLLGDDDQSLADLVREAIRSPRDPAMVRSLVAGLTWADRAEVMHRKLSASV